MAIRERWFVDGWEMTEGDVRDVEYRSGQLGTPAMRGENAVVANRTGEAWRPKVHGPGQFTLEVWFGISQAQAQAQWDTILRAVVSTHRLCTWRRITASGESRYCEGEVTASMEPTAIGQLAYRASIEVNVPRGYWWGETLFSAATSLDGAPAVGEDGKPYRDVALPLLAPSTAPMEGLQLRLDGQLVNPRVTDVTDYGRGEQLLYATTIPNGKGMTLDCETWGLTGHGGYAPAEAAVNHAGERYLTVAATKPGVVPTLRLSADTIGPAGRLTVAGRRSYLC